MKRRKELKSKKGLTRRASLKPKEWGIRKDVDAQRAFINRSRRPLPNKSARREDETPERQELVATVKREEPRCQARIPVICTGWTEEVNEIIRRSQWRAGFLVRFNTEGLCHNCHAFVTAHPGRAGWAARHGHQLLSTDRDDRDAYQMARVIRLATAGRCGADCMVDHREEAA